jgi:hypothetical protein
MGPWRTLSLAVCTLFAARGARRPRPRGTDPPGKKLAINPTNSYTMEGWRNTMGVVNMDLIRQMQTEEGN